MQWFLRPGGRGGPRGAQEGAAGLRPLEQVRGLLPGVQRDRCPHTGGHGEDGRQCAQGIIIVGFNYILECILDYIPASDLVTIPRSILRQADVMRFKGIQEYLQNKINFTEPG